MNPDIERLLPYPFERLAQLKAGLAPPAGVSAVSLSIGEPQHPTPGLIVDSIIGHLDRLSIYPNTRGMAELREAIARWLVRRFELPQDGVDPETQILPVSGTREALFSFAQAVVDRSRSAKVLMPNPFYQIYEGAALLAGGEPVYLPATAETGLLPDHDAVPPEVWDACQLLFICSPANPTGAVMDMATMQGLIELAERHDFIIASDECYSEIYFDESSPPPGLLQAAAAMGNDQFRRCVAFHSLSKRSNAPGLRSGFVAGDAAVIQRFFQYRTYHGCAMPPPHQFASTAAWSDELHVRANRQAYRDKFAAVVPILQEVLEVTLPAGAFYLWPKVPGSDSEFTRGLFAAHNLTVLPGSFLSREVDGVNPGAGRLRLALVAPLEDCVDAAWRIRRHAENLIS